MLLNTRCYLMRDFCNYVNRKNPCENDNNINTELQKTANEPQKTANKVENIIVNNKQCQYCDKIFARSHNLTIHLNGRCKIKKQQDNAKEDLLQKLIK